VIDREQIAELLPHRDPFLFVDRVVEHEPGAWAVGEHDVREDAFWVRGHFPERAVMPGVLIAETMAQVAALVCLTEHPDRAGGGVYLVGYDKLRFRKPVEPGVTLCVRATLTRSRRRMWMFEVEATVAGQRVANGSLMATVDLGD
jgi:3-hydroxyacyl-[acyl-carrier-protein] dehydratase